MVPGGYSPPQLFLSIGLVAAGAWLGADQPGNRALLVLDWPRLLLLAAVTTAALFGAERLAARRLRREARDRYPYRFAVLVALFGLGVAAVAAANAGLDRAPPRLLRPPVRGWVSARTAAGGDDYPSLPREGRYEATIATVDSWRRPGETLRIPVSAAAQEAAAGDGPHVLELEVSDGFLGVEYVRAVRLVAER